MRVPLSILLLALLMPLSAFGQDSSPTEKRKSTETSDENAIKEASPLRKLIDESLTWDQLFANETSVEPMEARVVMRWSNNTRGSETGATVLYLADGRPEVVCSIYPWDMKLIHEFDSLSRGKPVALREGNLAWRPDAAGVQFQTITDAEVPAETPAARLRQMKTLVRRFSSTMLGWRSDKADREELRLLPQPLYRYESKRKDILDGAVFAFAMGTDPETLLLIEAFQKQDKYEWQAAFVRNTSGELEGRDNDKIVWHADRYPDTSNPRLPHFNLYRSLEAGILSDTK